MLSKGLSGRLQTGAITVSMAFFGWMALTVYETRVSVAVLVEKVRAVENTISAVVEPKVSLAFPTNMPGMPAPSERRVMALPVMPPEPRRKE